MLNHRRVNNTFVQANSAEEAAQRVGVKSTRTVKMSVKVMHKLLDKQVEVCGKLLAICRHYCTRI